MYGSHEAELVSQVEETRRKLAETELEIEKYKEMLETEKVSNGQLVQWKAQNLKAVDNLKHELEAFKGIGDVNIAQLLAKLSERHTELDGLREDGRCFEELTEEKVRRPMREADAVRDGIGEVKQEKAGMLLALRAGEAAETARGVDVERMRVENVQLKRSNQLLMQEISALEAVKDKKASDVRHFMESTVAPPPPSIRASGKAPGFIVRPIVLPKAVFKL
jgi:hypothetical protein